METLFRFLAPASRCGYLPQETWRIEYEHVAAVSPAEYLERLRAGWRRFGHALFQPRCPTCNACRSLRVLVERFRPDRSQRRCWKINEGQVRVHVGTPAATPQKLQLYDRYHAFQADWKGWPQHPAQDADSYADSFVNNPFATQEWCYYVGNRLAAVGYADDLPGGLSAIYFFYDPVERHRSLGTYNILRLISHAQARGLPHLYLGYYVAGCRSMEYKRRFRPNEVLGPDGAWQAFG